VKPRSPTPRASLAPLIFLAVSQAASPAALALPTVGATVTSTSQLPALPSIGEWTFTNLDGSLRTLDSATTWANNSTTVLVELHSDNGNPFRVSISLAFLASKNFTLPKYELMNASGNTWTRVTPRVTAIATEVLVPSEELAWTDNVTLRITDEAVPWTLPSLLAGSSVYGFGNNASIFLNRPDALWWNATSTSTSLVVNFTPEQGTSNYGAEVRFNRAWLNTTYGITRPYFEFGPSGPPVLPIASTDNGSYWSVTMPHFSTIGVHQATNGQVDATVTSYTDENTLTYAGSSFSTTPTPANTLGTATGITGESYVTLTQRVVASASGWLTSIDLASGPSGGASNSCYTNDATYIATASVSIYADNGGAQGQLLDTNHWPEYRVPQASPSTVFGDGQSATFTNLTRITSGTAYWVQANLHGYNAGGSGRLLCTQTLPTNANYGSTDCSYVDWGGSTGTFAGRSCMVQLNVADTPAEPSGTNFINPSQTTALTVDTSQSTSTPWHPQTNYGCNGCADDSEGYVVNAGDHLTLAGVGWQVPANRQITHVDLVTSIDFASGCPVSGAAGASIGTATLYQASSQGGVPSSTLATSKTAYWDDVRTGYQGILSVTFDPPVTFTSATYVILAVPVPNYHIQNGVGNCAFFRTTQAASNTWLAWDDSFLGWHTQATAALAVIAYEDQLVPTTVLEKDNQASVVTVISARNTMTGTIPAGTTFNWATAYLQGGNQITLPTGGSLATATPNSGAFARILWYLNTTSSTTSATASSMSIAYTAERNYANADTRTVGTTSETNVLSATATQTYTTPVYKVPVSANAKSLSAVKYGSTTATLYGACPSTLASLPSGKYCYDSGNEYVYIAGSTVSNGGALSAEADASWGGTFSITIPGYVRSGDYILATGLVQDANGNPINGVYAWLNITNADGTSLANGVGAGPVWNIVNGDYSAFMATSYIPPGQYNAQVQFVDAVTSSVTTKAWPITIGNPPGVAAQLPGQGGNTVYADGVLYYQFYDTRGGEVLNQDFYKVYVSPNSTIDESSRVIGGRVPVTVGKTYYVLVKDYFNHVVFPPTNGAYSCSGYAGASCPFTSVSNGAFATLPVNVSQTFLDVGITLYQLKVKNTQTDPSYVSAVANGKTFTSWVLPGEVVTLYVPMDTYAITETMYDENRQPPTPVDYAFNYSGSSAPYLMATPADASQTGTIPASGVAGTLCSTVACSFQETDAGSPANGVTGAGAPCLDGEANTTNYCRVSATQSSSALTYFATLDLGRVAKATSMSLNFWDGDARSYYGFRVEVSADPIHYGWTYLYDSTMNTCTGNANPAIAAARSGATTTQNTACGMTARAYQSLQTLTFNPTDVRYVRVFCTGSTANSECDLTRITLGASASASLVINQDEFLWIRGYDLYSVVFAVSNVNSLVYNQEVNIGVHIQNQDSTVQQQTSTIDSQFNNSGTYVGTQLQALSGQISNQGATIQNQLSYANLNVNNTGSTITSQLNGVSSQVNNLGGSIGYQTNYVRTLVENDGIRPPVDATVAVSYAFEDASGSTAHDEGTSNDTLALSGGYSWTQGKYGGGVTFDGATGAGTAPDAPPLDTTSQVSITAWIMPSSVTGTAAMAWKQGQYGLYRQGTDVCFEVWTSTGATTLCSTTHPLATSNQWYHMAATYDGATMTVWVNAVPLVSLAKTGTISVTTNTLCIGADAANCSTDHFNGGMDEVRIYTRTLAANDVAAICNDLNPSVFTQFNSLAQSVSNANSSLAAQVNAANTSILNGQSQIQTQLTSVVGSVTNLNTTMLNQFNSLATTVQNTNASLASQTNILKSVVENNGIRPPNDASVAAAYSFEEGSGAIAHDEGPYHDDATITGNVTWVPAGRYGGALNFDGVTTNVSAPTPSLSQAGGTGISAGVWVDRASSGSATQAVFAISHIAELYLVGSDVHWLVLTTSGSEDIVSPGAASPGTWTDLAGTYDGTTTKLYVNGVIAASASFNGTLPNASPGGIYLGNAPTGGGTGTNYYAGWLDEFRLYDRSLNQTEVQALYYDLNPAVLQQFNSLSQGVTNTNASIQSQLTLATTSITNNQSQILNQLNALSTNVTNNNASVGNEFNLLSFQVQNLGTNTTTEVNSVWFAVNNTNSSLVNETTLVLTNISNFNTSVQSQFLVTETGITTVNGTVVNQTALIGVHLTTTESNLTNEITGVNVSVATSNSTIVNQLNSVAATIANSNLSILDQVDLVWAAVNTTGSTVTTQFNGLSARLDVDMSTINTSFSTLQTSVNYENTTILQNISSMNASLYAQMLGVLSDVDAKGSDAFNETTSILQNLTSTQSNLSASITAQALGILQQVGNINDTNVSQMVNLVLQNVSTAAQATNAAFQALGNEVGANFTSTINRLDDGVVNITQNLTTVETILQNATNSSETLILQNLSLVLHNLTTSGVTLNVPNLGNTTLPPGSAVYANTSLVQDATVVVTWTSQDTFGYVIAVQLYERTPGHDWGLITTGGAAGAYDLQGAIEGETYEFKTNAIDNAGNRESDPTLGSSNYVAYVYHAASPPGGMSLPGGSAGQHQALFKPLLVPNPTLLFVLLALLVAATLRHRSRRRFASAESPAGASAFGRKNS
jgi:predicted negative regulator of RcsB-dependent stress response